MCPLAYIDPNTTQTVFSNLGPFLGWIVAGILFVLWPLRMLCRYLITKIKTWPKPARWGLLIGIVGILAMGIFSLFGKGKPADPHAAVAPSVGSPPAPQAAKVIVIGMDGLDPDIMDGMMAKGELPHFAQLAKSGSYRRLQSSIPPESPVAWSTIATGCDAGEHGVFDFIQRDPETYIPYLSLRKPAVSLGSTHYKEARDRDGFWVFTTQAKIPTTIIRWPVAFPAEPVAGRFLSGFGVPDLLGGEGRYAYYTNAPVAADDALPSAVIPVEWDGTTATTNLRGPAAANGKPVSLTMKISKTDDKTVLIAIQNAEPIQACLKEWSEWIPVRFRIGFTDVFGQVKCLLTELGPGLRLYVSPIHMDPTKQAFPFTEPDTFGEELKERIGRFHTLGMPEQVLPLNHKRYGYAEFLAECKTISDERKKMLDLELGRFDKGLLAVVFDTSDRVQHALWSTQDPTHPAYDAETAQQFGHAIPDMYREMDGVLGTVLTKVDANTVLMVLSDHGFKSFRRAIHVNRWLIDNGYLHLKGGDDKIGADIFQNVDWSRTKAYAMGFSSIYLNVKGRDGQGIVAPGAEYDALLAEITAKLKVWKDPQDGQAVIYAVYPASQIYHGPDAAKGPDLILGTQHGYRFSWQTALGGAPLGLVEDNNKPWSGDHLYDRSFVPGILFCNRALNASSPAQEDIAPTILQALGVKIPAHMHGQPLLVMPAGTAQPTPVEPAKP